MGISTHTNEAGAQAVARAFPEYATSTVQVRQPFRSLKDAVGVAGINVLAVGESDTAQLILKVGGIYSIGSYIRFANEPISLSCAAVQEDSLD